MGKHSRPELTVISSLNAEQTESIEARRLHKMRLATYNLLRLLMTPRVPALVLPLVLREVWGSTAQLTLSDFEKNLELFQAYIDEMKSA